MATQQSRAYQQYLRDVGGYDRSLRDAESSDKKQFREEYGAVLPESVYQEQRGLDKTFEEEVAQYQKELAERQAEVDKYTQEGAAGLEPYRNPTRSGYRDWQLKEGEEYMSLYGEYGPEGWVSTASLQAWGDANNAYLNKYIQDNWSRTISRRTDYGDDGPPPPPSDWTKAPEHLIKQAIDSKYITYDDEGNASRPSGAQYYQDINNLERYLSYKRGADRYRLPSSMATDLAQSGTSDLGAIARKEQDWEKWGTRSGTWQDSVLEQEWKTAMRDEYQELSQQLEENRLKAQTEIDLARQQMEGDVSIHQEALDKMRQRYADSITKRTESLRSLLGGNK